MLNPAVSSVVYVLNCRIQDAPVVGRGRGMGRGRGPAPRTGQRSRGVAQSTAEAGLLDESLDDDQRFKSSSVMSCVCFKFQDSR